MAFYIRFKNYIKNYIQYNKNTNPYWSNITIPGWYKYILLFILQIFIIFGLIILFQILFPRTIFISLFIPYALIFAVLHNS